MARKTYDAATIANALAVLRAEGNLLRASKLLGISRSTLRAWSKGQLPGPVASESPLVFNEREVQAGRTLAKQYREVEGLYLENLKKPEVIAKTSAAQSAIVVGVMSDKAARAEGGPTSIHETREIRYVASDSLQQMATERMRALSVIDVKALPAGPTTPQPAANGRKPRED